MGRLYRTAEAYTAWTDAQTPDTPNDGKVFFVHDYHFNYFQVGVASLGGDFFDGDQVSFGPDVPPGVGAQQHCP